MELDHIGDAPETQSGFFQGHGRYRADAMALFRQGLIGPGMKQTPFGRLPVLGPQTLDMNQGALARTEQIVLQGGEGNEVFLFHDSALRT